jgi:hypothetical protein
MNRIVVGLIAAVVGAVVGAGCSSPQAKTQGTQQDITATYEGRTLRADLPGRARVPAVIAAADQTFRARGYAVQRSAATEDTGEIVANAPRHSSLPRVVVSASRGVETTGVRVMVEPFGDQELSRSVLDGVLQRLGL